MLSLQYSSSSKSLTPTCKLLPSARDQLSVRRVSPYSSHGSQNITEWNTTIREEGEESAAWCASPDSPTTFSDGN
ncbi:hypothetical protein CgunFtcFv8_010334 [Champsocephalus gunnari]|uniref:Uncharacterized protein n=1 Tax=Champsocephalus gunnari TaxID=52237 RepID=A0AAN8DTH4_CHAGU|nr:hypothetical protein CgunFtcFv8_010334 [Champsocephalus gunnari]